MAIIPEKPILEFIGLIVTPVEQVTTTDLAQVGQSYIKKHPQLMQLQEEVLQNAARDLGMTREELRMAVELVVPGLVSKLGLEVVNLATQAKTAGGPGMGLPIRG